MATDQTHTGSQFKGHYADVNGLKMYYETYGAGSPLVLIHGGGSTIFTTFGNVLHSFAKDHKVIAVELQADGHTADIDRPLSFEQDADDVAALMKLLNIAKADILGFSNGGSTALQIAIRYPELVNRLIVLSAIYKRSDIPSWFWDMMQNSTFEDMPQVYKAEYLKINPGDNKGLLAMYKRDVTRMQTFKDWDEADVRSIHAPVLVIVSDQDVVRPEGAVELYRLLPNSRLSILPGTHGECLGEIMTQHPDDKKIEYFVSMVKEFLQLPASVFSK